MKLLVAGSNAEPTMHFRLEQDNNTNSVDIYANDDLIGWFEVSNGNVVFVRSFPNRKDTKAAFGTNGTELITVRDS